jgi:FAD dependent oxidoreductase
MRCSCLLLLLLGLGTSLRAGTVQVLDVLRVRADGDASAAVVSLRSGPGRTFRCDVAIIGGGMGGVSAALETARAGRTVCMTEPTLWIGGQMTSEGVSAMDDNKWIETTGATASYRDLSQHIRERYAHGKLNLNPGNCWVSHLCFEPSAGEDVLRAMLQPLIAKGTIQLWLHTVPVMVSRQGRQIQSVLAYDFGHGKWLRLEASYFVDASELGDLIGMSGLPFRLGSEARSDTGERDAPTKADPDDIQSFTYPFILLRGLHKPSPAAQMPPPTSYDSLKSKYGFVVDYGHGKFLTYGMFARNPGTPGSFWDYRRSVDAAQFRTQKFAGDLSTINWSSNDYCGSRLLSTDPQAQADALAKAKRLSLGFAWWLQHDAPRDDHAGSGYPELALQRSAMGSGDGLSQQPYIRESRRMIALHTIVEESLVVDFQKGARAAEYPDSVGIGQYSIDIHSCARQDFISATKPYEIPLGALIARDADNLLAAAKNIGTTHITNGAYRLHPTEWSIGEAVGAVVVWSLEHKTSPAAIDRSPAEVAGLQRRLLQQGHPIFWFDDVGAESPLFKGSQMASAHSWIPTDSSTLHFDASAVLCGDVVANALERAGISQHMSAGSLTRIRAAKAPNWRDLRGAKLVVAAGDRVITRGDFAVWLFEAGMR